MKLQIELEEYYQETLIPVCGHWNYESFKEWIREETDWAIYEGSNRSWISTKTRKVISTETLYQLYATSKGSEKILEELKIQSIL